MVATKIKTDNGNLAAKLDLRRYFLSKYHADGQADVLDCCQGSGVIWTALRREFSIRSYWGMDLKAKKGRLKLDSSRVLSQPGWPQNVVDVDTYGSPWRHWEGILANLSRPTTVFLTIGQLTTGTVGSLAKEAIGAMGLGPLAKGLPKAFHVKLAEFALSCCLKRTCDNVTILELVEAVSTGNARYIGARIGPRERANANAGLSPKPT